MLVDRQDISRLNLGVESAAEPEIQESERNQTGERISGNNKQVLSQRAFIGRKDTEKELIKQSQHAKWILITHKRHEQQICMYPKAREAGSDGRGP